MSTEPERPSTDDRAAGSVEENVRTLCSGFEAAVRGLVHDLLRSAGEDRLTAVREARAASEAEAARTLSQELTRARTESAERLATQLARARTEAAETLEMEVARVRTETTQTMTAELTRQREEAAQAAAAEAGRLREEAAQTLASELARQREEAAQAAAAEAGRLREEAAQTLASELARQREEAAQAAAAEAGRLREEAAQTLASELARQREEAAAEAAQLREEAAQILSRELARERSEAAQAAAAEAHRLREEAAQTLASELARAQREASETLGAELARVQAESEAALAAVRQQAAHALQTEVTRARVEERQAVLSGWDRLLAGTRQLDEARTLTEVLDALAGATSQEAARMAMFVSQAGRVHGWRFHGFGPEMPEARSVNLLADETGIIGQAIETGVACSLPARSGQVSPAGPHFTALQEGRVALAVPVRLAGRTVAVVYADDMTTGARPVPDAWPEAIEILVRHAGRCLESLTALKTSLTGAYRAAASPSRSHVPERSPAA
jgi:hypothetical protein